jgi:hypothetical protein
MRNYRRWMLRNLDEGTVDPNIFFISNDAWFRLSGSVKARNTQHWDIENPHAVPNVLLQDEKVGVWCAVCARKNNWASIFYETVNSGRCEQSSGTFLSNHL